MEREKIKLKIGTKIADKADPTLASLFMRLQLIFITSFFHFLFWVSIAHSWPFSRLGSYLCEVAQTFSSKGSQLSMILPELDCWIF